jgi:hypothetical protein
MGRESFFAGQSSALLSCFLSNSLVLPSRVAWLILECARRTRPFSGRAFREQENDQAAPPPPGHSFPILPVAEQLALTKYVMRALFFLNKIEACFLTVRRSYP